MNYSLFIGIILALLLVSCGNKKTVNEPATVSSFNTKAVIPDEILNKSELNYDNSTSQWTLNNGLYSGYAITYYRDSILKEKFGILNGRMQNEAIEYYPDEHYKHLSHYHEGKLHGPKKFWSADSSHILLSHLNYVSGKLHGEQRKWYPTGELFKKLNLNMGREEGIQQAFRINGDLYANYEAKNGRIFGLKKAALCFGIEDEKVKYED